VTCDTSTEQSTVRECERKLARYRAALEAGTDPALVAGWITQVTAEHSAAQTAIAAAKLAASDIVTAEELRAAVEKIGGLLPLLEVSDPRLRARFYEEVGLHGTYDPKARVVNVEARVLNGRVGGGTCTPSTPRFLRGELHAA
jgi:site-specific DNA recombinase